MPAVFSGVTTGPAAGFRFTGPVTVLLKPDGEVAMYSPPPFSTFVPKVIAATLPGIRYGALGGWAYGPRGATPRPKQQICRLNSSGNSSATFDGSGVLPPVDGYRLVRACVASAAVSGVG